MMLIQIYAFTKQNEAVEAAHWGVNHIGFVAGDYGLVHGELSLKEAAEMARVIQSAGARAVALTMATDVYEIVRMAKTVRPDIVHISTEPEEVNLQAMEWLRGRLPGSVEFMKAIAIDGEESIQVAQKYAQVSDWLLLDTKVKGMPGVGATGQVHDWDISRRIVQAVHIPVILAGGLSAENVASSIEKVHPAGVDSNTATNLPDDPVQKDMEQIRKFIEAVRPQQGNR